MKTAAANRGSTMTALGRPNRSHETLQTEAMRH
jgi:hypothetical protein